MEDQSLQNMLRALPAQLAALALRIVLALLIVFIALKLIRHVTRLTERAMTRVHADEGVRAFLTAFVGAALKVLLCFGVLTAFGIDTAGVIALLGSAGVAIGLAVQGSLSNLAGGVMILLLRPFKIGDYIQEDAHGHEGTVREISLFTTKLTTYDNKVVILPNGELANTSITNLTGSVTRMLEIRIGVAYDSDIALVKDLLRGIAEDHPAVIRNEDKPIQAYVDDYADSAVMMGLRCWLPTENFRSFKWEIMERIKQRFDENGVVIPFPQREVRLKSEAG